MEKEQLEMSRHSLAHVLAKALQNLYKNVKFTIGPAIEDGLYYDIDLDQTISEQELPKIQKEMKNIIAKSEKFERKVISKQEALELFKNNEYKTELINELPANEEISIYTLGNDFVDLCRGPHVEHAGKLANLGFKVAKVNGAYWRGNENNKMLQRIYVYAFENNEKLEEYVKFIEEAKLRNHKKLGRELELFFFDETAPGMAYWLPKGFTIMNTLIEFWRKEHQARGYQEFTAPQLNSSVLWKTSGHWDHYKEDMFVLTDADGAEQALKPMNCPNSIMIYKSKMRSYKDLPLRFNDVDVIHRNEKSGQLNGLFRVRMFRQDDSHNYITKDQIGSEIKQIVEIADKFYKIFGLSYELTLSTRPDDFMGEIETWNTAEAELKKVLNEICGENNYRINEKDGAFYGPKIDIKMKDCLNREWQMGTVQLDFQLPGKFGLTYIDQNGEKQTPILIHRAIFGSFERFIGIITEHFAGAFPVWLSPVQVKVMSITEKHEEYAKEIYKKLLENNIRAELDIRNEKIGFKTREGYAQKIPYMLVIGDNEQENKLVSVRGRKNYQENNITLEKFIEKIKKEIEEKTL